MGVEHSLAADLQRPRPKGPMAGSEATERMGGWLSERSRGALRGYAIGLVAVILVRPLGVIQWVQNAYCRWLRLLGGKNAPRS